MNLHRFYQIQGNMFLFIRGSVMFPFFFQRINKEILECLSGKVNFLYYDLFPFSNW